jgi:carbohydrate diacid regulator
MRELKNFVVRIKDNAKIKFGVYDKTGKFLLGDEIFSKIITDFENIKTESDKTLFNFTFLGEKYIGAIEHFDVQIASSYAYLIMQNAGLYRLDVEPQSRQEFFSQLIDGKIGYLSSVRYADKLKIKEKKCAVLIMLQDKGQTEDVVQVASNYVESTKDCVFSYDDKRSVLIKFLSDNNKEYRSIIEYAEFLSQTVYEETGIKIKVAIGGVVKRFVDLEKSFAQALSVFSMEKTISKTGNVRSFREFVVVKALDELPVEKKEEYLNLLFDDCNKDIFNDEVLLLTAEEFFESNLNISLASRKTFLHRNTLTYRLDKIQRETGLDLRRYNDAVTFRLITVLNKLLGK